MSVAKEDAPKLTAAQKKKIEAQKQKENLNEGGNKKPLETGTDQPVLDVMHVAGAFTVRAISDAGFWRSGVQFHRQQEKLVLVVESDAHAVEGLSTPDHKPECVVCLTEEKALRVYEEPHLIVEQIELETLIALGMLTEQADT